MDVKSAYDSTLRSGLMFAYYYTENYIFLLAQFLIYFQ